MKKALILSIIILAGLLLTMVSPYSVNAYSNNNLIVDQVFDNSSTMDTAGIQN